MTEYIDRDEAIVLIEALQKQLCPVGRYGRSYVYGTDRDRYDQLEEILDSINKIPTADVAPVRHGKWVDKPTGRYRQWQSWCSVCENRSGIGGIESNRHKPCCPNCGAKMDLESQ